VPGELQVQIATYEDGSTATFYGLVTPSGDTIDLVFDAPPAIDPGTFIAVRGDRDIEGKLHVSSIEVTPEPPDEHLRALALPEGATEPLPALKIAVLVLDPLFTAAQARKRLLEDVDGPKNFYRENTYGAWNIEGDAFDVPNVDTSNCGSRYNTIATNARAAARTAGIDIDSYQQVAYFIPRSANCGWGGLGSVGKMPSRTASGPSYGRPARDSWYGGGLSCVAFNQELGHNYGLQHGHLCTSAPYAGGCPGYREYGDPYSPMGTGCAHLTAVESGELNAFAPCNVIDVADGTYEIGPLEVACTGPQVLRWKDPKGARRAEYVHLEYRRKIGHDNTTRVIEGVYVHYGAEYKDTSVLSWQTPANGASDFLVPAGGTSAAAGLRAGQSWTAVGGATFRVVSLAATATIEVTNSQRSSGATCLDATPAPTGPPVCCSTGTCDGGSRPDAGTPDAARVDASDGSAGQSDSGGRDGRTAEGAAGEGGAGGRGGSSGGAGADGGPTPVGSGGTSASTTGSSGARSTPAPSDAVGGCSCRVANAVDRRGHAWASFAVLVSFALRRRRRPTRCMP